MVDIWHGVPTTASLARSSILDFFRALKTEAYVVRLLRSLTLFDWARLEPAHLSKSPKSMASMGSLFHMLSFLESTAPSILRLSNINSRRPVTAPPSQHTSAISLFVVRTLLTAT